MYYVNRNGQQYGPYSEETIRRYLAEGSLLASDSARSEGAQSWQPLGQILQYTPLSARPPAVPPPAPRPAGGVPSGPLPPAAQRLVPRSSLPICTGQSCCFCPAP